jgi:hypothetical protein
VVSPSKTVVLPLFVDDGNLYSKTKVYTYCEAAYIQKKFVLYFKSKGY